jgi:OmpA-OmpF porin, OOP family
MKNLFCILAVLFSVQVNSQSMNKSSIGFNIGGHDGMSKTNHYTRLNQLNHYELNYRYMMNNRFGLKFDAGFDNFQFIDDHPTTNALRFSIQPTFNLTDLLHMNNFSTRWGILLHMGAGYAAMWNKEVRGPNEILNLKEGSVDEMLQGIIGLTPQFKLNERLSINGDIAFMGNIRQNYGFDFESAPIQGGGFSGYYATATIGFSYYIGKSKNNADWTYSPTFNPLVMQENLNRIIALETLAKEAEAKLGDDDKDGVINAVDQEVNSPLGNKVDITGKTIIETPPTDLNSFGIADIMFVKGSFYINPIYYRIMDRVVSYMAANPTKKISVSGHTDIDGSDEINNKISEVRVNNVVNYLIKKGADKNRLEISFKGKKQVKYPGNTSEVDAANRRVQFTIIQ